jgi:hypothetical protein
MGNLDAAIFCGAIQRSAPDGVKAEKLRDSQKAVRWLVSR